LKTALFVEGGGMKCAYSAGVLDAFLDAGLSFDYAIGVSAGAANICSFLAGQRDRNRRYYVVHSTDKRYMSFRSYLKTGNYFGLQFIYGDMTNEGGGDPLDYDKLIENPTEFYFPATDGETGLPHYFKKEDCRRNDYRPIMATCALPVVSNPVEIDGRFYFDGGVSDSIPIRKMKADGCDRIVCLMSKPEGFVMQPQGHKKFYTMKLRKKFPKVVERLDRRYIDYNNEQKELLETVNQGGAMLFRPSGEVKMSTYTRDPAVMQLLYDEGLSDGRSRINEVKEYINKE
jgi:predicted patatin/cPLA2 family phospholipase